MYNKAWREETTLCCKPPPRQERQLGALHPKNPFGNKSDIPFLPPEEKHLRILSDRDTWQLGSRDNTSDSEAWSQTLQPNSGLGVLDFTPQLRFLVRKRQVGLMVS